MKNNPKRKFSPSVRRHNPGEVKGLFLIYITTELYYTGADPLQAVSHYKMTSKMINV